MFQIRISAAALRISFDSKLREKSRADCVDHGSPRFVRAIGRDAPDHCIISVVWSVAPNPQHTCNGSTQWTAPQLLNKLVLPSRRIEADAKAVHEEARRREVEQRLVVVRKARAELEEKLRSAEGLKGAFEAALVESEAKLQALAEVSEHGAL